VTVVYVCCGHVRELPDDLSSCPTCGWKNAGDYVTTDAASGGGRQAVAHQENPAVPVIQEKEGEAK